MHVRAQGHGAHEHSDQLVEQRIVAAGLGSPQQGVRRAGDRRQQHRDRRMQHHEGRRVDAPGHGTERRPHLTVEAGRDPLRAAAGCRPGSIQRHTGNGWSPFEHALPEPEIAVTDPRVQQFVLPARVVRVIHRQRGPRGRRACASRGVGRGEIGDQRRERESVESDVMRHDDEFVTPSPIRCSANRIGTSVARSNGSDTKSSINRWDSSRSRTSRVPSTAARSTSTRRGRGSPSAFSVSTVRNGACRRRTSPRASRSASSDSSPTSSTTNGTW